jgi:hypothetical protein
MNTSDWLSTRKHGSDHGMTVALDTNKEYPV